MTMGIDEAEWSDTILKETSTHDMPLDKNGFPTDTLNCSKCNVTMESIGPGIVSDDTVYDRWRCPGCKKEL